MTLFSAATLGVLAWGALAFGAEYTWAYLPLIVFASVAGILGLRVPASPKFPRPLLFAMLLIAGVTIGQLLPQQTTPAQPTEGAVDYDRLRAEVTQQVLLTVSVRRSLSIARDRTELALASLVSLLLLLTGATKAFGSKGARSVARSVIALGVAVAFVGIIQASFQSKELFGFWRPPKDTIPFAPFVNENHFAGWMVMAMSLALGSLSGSVSVATRQVRSGWRDRVLWLSSSAASEAILTGAGVVIMALAMVLTLSRGGLVGLATAILVSVLWVARRRSTGAGRVAGGVVLVLGFFVVSSWGGVERTLAQFEGSGIDWGGRRTIWLDTWRIIQDHPWTGTGLNTFGVAMLRYQSGSLAERVIEAHNDYLQLAAEGGLLLGVPILITIALLIREVWRRFKEGADDERTYWLRAGAVTGLCSIAVMEMFDFTLQMPGATVLFVVLVAIAIHQPDYLVRRREAGAQRE